MVTNEENYPTLPHSAVRQSTEAGIRRHCPVWGMEAMQQTAPKVSGLKNKYLFGSHFCGIGNWSWVHLGSGEGSGPPLQCSSLRIPGTEEPGGLQSKGSRRVRHDWATSLSLFTFTHWRRKWQPTAVFLPGESQGRGSLVGCRLAGHTESDTTEAT